MLFQKSLLREIQSTAGLVFAVLFTTLVTLTLIGALGRAASGRVDPELVLPLIVFNTVSLMNSVVMLTVYISILMVLSRWWRDSEMVIWLSSGKSLLDFLKPMAKFVLPMALLVAVLSIVVAPWSRQQIINFEDEIENRGEAKRIAPGQFRESSSGRVVVFLENLDDEEGKIGTVFLRSIDPDSGRNLIVVSSTGRFETDKDGQQWVLLERGYRSDFIPGQLDTRTTRFEKYHIRMDPSSPVMGSRQTMRSIPILDLVKKSELPAKGELALRVGFPLLTLALGLIAIPLAVSSARTGRATNLMIALLIYVIASNLFSTMTVMVSQGKMSLAMGWWPLHTMLAMVGLIMLWWHITQRPSLIDLFWALMRKAGMGRRSSLASASGRGN